MYYGEGGQEEKPLEQKYKYLYILSVLNIYWLTGKMGEEREGQSDSSN